MEAMRSWWQKNKKWLWYLGLTIVGLSVVVLVIRALVVNGTGFDASTTVSVSQATSTSGTTVTTIKQYQQGKTLWDWLQLLIIPVVLAVAALLFNLATTRTEQKIALDKQREDLLQVYLDRMSELLLKEKLGSSEADAEVRNVARVRTITILFQLDARRIGYVFAFLRETRLMSNKPNSSIVSLYHANLSDINLSQSILSGADLSGANLFEANLSFTNSIEANLSKASLLDADLRRAFLREADLREADLRRADLRRADLFKANLSGADLRGARLRGANLSRANLFEAKISEEQLKEPSSLRGATMPNGSIYQ